MVIKNCIVTFIFIVLFIVSVVYTTKLYKSRTYDTIVNSYGISKSADEVNNKQSDKEVMRFLYNFDLVDMHIREQEKLEKQNKNKPVNR